MAHGKTAYWLENGKLRRASVSVWCLGDPDHFDKSWNWDSCVSWTKARWATGSAGGYCEDCLRKLGAIW